MGKVKLDEIAEVHMFTDKEGRRIQEFRPFKKGEVSVFAGETIGIIGVGGDRQLKIPMSFEIGRGITVQQAFKRFDEEGKKAVDAEVERQKQAINDEQYKIVRAGVMPTGPDGKPLPIPGLEQGGGSKIIKP